MTIHKNPAVAIIVPAAIAGDDDLARLLAQDYPDFSVTVVGSGPEARSSLQPAAAADARLHTLEHTSLLKAPLAADFNVARPTTHPTLLPSPPPPAALPACEAGLAGLVDRLTQGGGDDAYWQRRRAAAGYDALPPGCDEPLEHTLPANYV